MYERRTTREQQIRDMSQTATSQIDIADRLHVTRQHIQKIIKEMPDGPEINAQLRRNLHARNAQRADEERQIEALDRALNELPPPFTPTTQEIEELRAVTDLATKTVGAHPPGSPERIAQARRNEIVATWRREGLEWAMIAEYAARSHSAPFFWLNPQSKHR